MYLGKFLLWRGKHYCVYNGFLYEFAPEGGPITYLHTVPTDLLRHVVKRGYTGTIAEKVAGNIHVYGHQLGKRAQTLSHEKQN